MKVIKKLFKHISKLILDENEKKFINFSHSEKQKFKYNALVVVPEEYYYVCYNYILSNERLKNFNIYGFWPYFINLNRKRNFEKFHNLKTKFYYKFVKKKFFKIYKSFNFFKIWDLDELNKKYISPSENYKIIKISNKIYSTIRNKEEILNLKIENIYCGDLIYDSYIRFRNQPTVDINDKFLKEIIYLSLLAIRCYKKLQRDYCFKYLYTSFATYIQYGLLVRVFLNCGVKVYSGSTLSQYNKSLSKKDFYHVDNYRKFKETFKKLKNKEKKIIEGKKFIRNIFFKNRSNLTFKDYMNVNPYKKNIKKTKLKYDGIIFLPNFFESQREWGKLIFIDFYEWINFTCKLISNNNLNIALKPHPNIYNINKESVEVVEQLKQRYKNISWISPFISNHEIFKSVKFGISPWGTVLWEMAYFGVNAISTGDHPAIKYNFGFNPRSKKEYKEILLSASKLSKFKVNKNKIYEYCYMYYINKNDAFKSLAREIQLHNIKFENSTSLLKFIKKIKSYEQI